MTRSTTTTRRRSAGLVLAPVAGLAMIVLIAAPAQAGPPDDAAAYLVAQLTDGDHLEIGGFVQYGPTIDVGLGLLAAESEAASLDAIAAFLSTEDAVFNYVHGGGFDAPDAAYAGATAKLGFFASITGGDPRDVGGEDLVDTLLSLEGNDGRFADHSDFGDFSNIIGQSFAILSLTAADGVEPSDAAVRTLVNAQCDDGGYTLDFDGGDCVGTADATGIAVQALNASDPGESGALTPEREEALVAAAAWLVDNREVDGSYLLDGVANVNTTGYGAIGVLAVGLDASPSVAWLVSVQLPDGGLPLSPGAESDVLATAQALPALSGDSFLSLDPAVLGASIVVPGPTATPTETQTQTPTGTVTPTTSTPTLPPTGSSSSALTVVAIGFCAVGLAVVIAARRGLSRA